MGTFAILKQTCLVHFKFWNIFLGRFQVEMYLYGGDTEDHFREGIKTLKHILGDVSDFQTLWIINFSHLNGVEFWDTVQLCENVILGLMETGMYFILPFNMS